MNFNQAKQLLREHGYSVTKHVDRRPTGVTAYDIHRIYQDGETNAVGIKRWLLTADDIKAGVFRAQSIWQERN